ncbi:MAG: QacE family quaternary ammonium compound efflux SMR transporter [Sulfitobacter sp.]|uniref:QacE family quaternary ammonium compound efflux SMR transporter n=1 Tax=Sulfitobacter sediminilitoris TaxID=2698830 RepID=A0A6P0CCC8_9RHOB|nr:SMR family transporter [Sulfitobacter sediminilitoris]NEK23547.1 QacE family quaternary ammonium compound efflux SMR transporter [Sulfitobacter sediminilitoris]NNK15446.1 QacE family quaternary ammonium compound efflux SMR transporter [Sulfitobacter sp.]
MPTHYIWLFFAILTETLGTTALQASQQFTRLWPSVGVVIFYGMSFYFMAIALKFMPVGIVYAIWSGLGIVLIAGIGYVLFGQKLDLAAVLGLAMIIGGIVIIHLFSASSTH